MAGILNNKIHVVFLPYFTYSHMLPLIDIAMLFAILGGLKVSIITTPHNAALFRFSIDQGIKAGLRIAMHCLKFPSEEFDLPEGIESFDTVTSPAQYLKLKCAIGLLQKPMENLTRSLSPDCIFSDMFFPWSADMALELKIPRLMFIPHGFFFRCMKHNLMPYTPNNKVVESGTETSSVLELPDKLKLKRSQLVDPSMTTSIREKIRAIGVSQTRSYGTVHDTFIEVEPAYADLYKNVFCKRSWHIGPLFHFTGRNEVQISGDIITRSDPNCLKWLDTQKPKSVVYVCFGNLVKFNDTQFAEIVLALNASNQPFVLVTKKNMCVLGEFKENKGIIINEWAPQIKILNHSAVGGFMTHCGWDSVLEAMVAGVPLITWPLFAEQFYNEKFIIHIIGNGVEVGSDVNNSSPEINSPVIGKDKIKNAVMRLMSGSGESDMIRRRAEEISVMAKRATEEGGSSYKDLMTLIEDIKACAIKK